MELNTSPLVLSAIPQRPITPVDRFVLEGTVPRKLSLSDGIMINSGTMIERVRGASLSLRHSGGKKKIEDAEKINLMGLLKQTLHAIEKTLHLTEKDLESHLEDAEYGVDRAASVYLERAGLRLIEPNLTLRRTNFNDDALGVTNAWSPCDANVFNVRFGPHYRKSKIKAQAKPQTLYECIAVDMYRSEEKLAHMSRFMNLGDLETENTLLLPELFIINFMLPLVEPKMFGSDSNGPTVCFHFIFRLSEWARQNPTSNSVQLVSKFINDCGPSGSMRERLKIIVQIANPDEMNLGKIERGLCRQYNGLPFLYRTYNSQYHRGAGWFQADFDGHRSGYTTRLARFSLMQWAETIVANIGFLVESESDEEMPERILGCANVHRLRVMQAQNFAKPMPTPLLSPKKTSPKTLTESRNSLDDDAMFEDAVSEDEKA